MKYLFIFAHPDDEAVATGGTIRRLVDRGDEVKLILATDGSAGTILGDGLGKHKSVSDLRQAELKKSCQLLGIKEFEVLNFPDGKIANKDIWGNLSHQFVGQIESYQPNVVVTFDHTGWSFHLDHVAVSIAVTRAVRQTKHKVDAFLLALFRPKGFEKKWPYVYPQKLPATHAVDIKKVLGVKIAALKAHASQKFAFMELLEAGGLNQEYFQLVFGSVKGRRILRESKIFKEIESA